MRLTTFTDYSLRTLMYLAMNRDRLVTISDISDDHGVARNHLTKVVNHLGRLGYIETVRGRSGGLRLGMEPEDIVIGDVVRNAEPDFHIAACFEEHTPDCLYASACALKSLLGRANDAFLAELDGATLADMVRREVRKKGRHGAVPGGVKAVAMKMPTSRRKSA